MPQGMLPFKYEEEKKDFGTIALCGSLLYLDLLCKMRFFQTVSRHLHAKKGKQGWSDAEFVVAIMLLNICGGDCVDDMKNLEGDEGFRRILKNIELHGVWGRRRVKIKRQWRNGKRNSFPSPSSIFRYLFLFHNAVEEKRREQGKSFIPESLEHLLGFCKINNHMLEFLQSNKPEAIATLDMDATLVESHKKEALYSYKKYKSYQPLNTWWWEQGVVVHTEFRDGNVGAGFEQTRVLDEALDCLPQGIKKVYLRSDTAGYQHDLLKYCEVGKNKRFGRIEFAIGCDVTPEFKKEVFRVEESEWHAIHKKVKGELKETGQEWAEIPFVPNAIGHSKNGPDYRYIGIREELKQKELPGLESQMSFPFPTMQMNGKRYKLFGLVSNMDWEGEALIHWSRKRCGYSEQVHSEMKESFAGGQLPSGKFGANAAWWWMMVLALNLNVLMKSLVLEKTFKTKRMKAIRFSLINIAGRVVCQGRELIVRVTKGHRSFDLLIKARSRILSLAYLPSG